MSATRDDCCEGFFGEIGMKKLRTYGSLNILLSEFYKAVASMRHKQPRKYLCIDKACKADMIIKLMCVVYKTPEG